VALTWFPLRVLYPQRQFTGLACRTSRHRGVASVFIIRGCHLSDNTRIVLVTKAPGNLVPRSRVTPRAEFPTSIGARFWSLSGPISALTTPGSTTNSTRKPSCQSQSSSANLGVYHCSNRPAGSSMTFLARIRWPNHCKYGKPRFPLRRLPPPGSRNAPNNA
jgi:hypothetical protein